MGDPIRQIVILFRSVNVAQGQIASRSQQHVHDDLELPFRVGREFAIALQALEHVEVLPRDVLKMLLMASRCETLCVVQNAEKMRRLLEEGEDKIPDAKNGFLLRPDLKVDAYLMFHLLFLLGQSPCFLV